jgi:hypothetical protein
MDILAIKPKVLKQASSSIFLTALIGERVNALATTGLRATNC